MKPFFFILGLLLSLHAHEFHSIADSSAVLCRCGATATKTVINNGPFPDENGMVYCIYIPPTIIYSNVTEPTFGFVPWTNIGFFWDADGWHVCVMGRKLW